jgi:hypothetical protein
MAYVKGKANGNPVSNPATDHVRRHRKNER